MNASRLIRHVMWIDVRAQRGLLAVWGFVLLAQAALFAAGPEGFGRYSARVSYDFGIELVRFGWTIIVAAMFVQSDSLVGTTAFWMTRPIPRAVLFTAKLLSAVLWLVVVPIAVMAGVLLWLGMRPLDALAGGGMIGLEQAVILAMVIVAALVTANIGQLVVAGIAGVTLVAVFNGLLLPVLTLAWPSVGDTLRGGQPTVYAITVMAGALAVAAYQYLTLRAWQSLVLIACTMFLATTLTRLWPAPPPVPAIGPVPESVMTASAVSLTASSLAPRIQDTATMSQGKRTISKRILVETTSAGHPPGIYFWPVFVTTDIRFPTLSPIHWSGPSTLTAAERASSDRSEGQPWRSIHVALGNVDFEAPRRWIYVTSIADVTEAEFHLHSFTPGQLKTDITMVAYRYDVTAVTPLKAGGTLSTAGRAVRILSVTGLNPGARIELRETLMEAAPQLGHSGFGISWYVLRNNVRRQALLLEWKDIKMFFGTAGISATAVTTTTGVLEIEIPSEFAHRFNMDAAWLDGAELVLVEPKPLGVLTRPLTIDNFILGGPPAGSASTQPDDDPGTVTLQRRQDGGRAGARRSQEDTSRLSQPKAACLPPVSSGMSQPPIPNPQSLVSPPESRIPTPEPRRGAVR